MFENSIAQKGFSLTELVVVMAVFFVLASVSVSVFSVLRNKKNLDLATNILVQSLRRAQNLSQSAKGDSPWGVKLSSSQIILFRGTGFSGRDVGFDDTVFLPTGITLSGNTEIVYSKFYGLPNQVGTTTLSSQWGNKSIYLNEKGIINF